MKALVIQHVPFEGPAAIAPILESKGFTIQTARLFEQDLPSSPDEFALIVIMGGPMSVHDTGTIPWLKYEKKFINEALHKGIRTIGICLGAQLISEALGGYVTRNNYKEIGWFKVQLTDEGRKHPVMSGIPAEITTLHWHGETFSIPDGAVRLAESSACANQAFLYKNNGLALQFHFEADAASATLLTENASSDLTGGEYVRSADEILSVSADVIAENNLCMEKLISNFILL